MPRLFSLFTLITFSVLHGNPTASGQAIRQSAAPAATVLVDCSALHLVEQNVLPPVLVPGPAAHDSLSSYYVAANGRLADRCERMRQLYETTADRYHQALTLVAGDAGVGKTFLKSIAFKKDYPAAAVVKLDIRQQYQQWLQDGIAVLKPDLTCGDQVINSLPSISDSRDKPLLRLLKAKSAQFVVLDSIDEVHPDDYVALLDQIEQFAFSGEQAFVHAVVFGRPCAFVDYWSRRDHSHRERDIQLFALEPPQLRTTGDLLVSTWNYCTFKFDAQWRSPAGQMVPLPLEVFKQWAEADFDQSGTFSQIALQPNREMLAQVHDALVQYAAQNRIVGPLLCNLAGNGIIREIVADRTHRGLPYDERALMDAYFRAWLERDYQSDGRPSFEHPEHVELYLQLLESVAVKYVVERQVDAEGYFTVSESDRVQIVHEGQQLCFSARRILDRSGLKHIDLRETGQLRYRFEPIWMHRYLVQCHNERLEQQFVVR